MQAGVPAAATPAAAAAPTAATWAALAAGAAADDPLVAHITVSMCIGGACDRRAHRQPTGPRLIDQPPPSRWTHVHMSEC